MKKYCIIECSGGIGKSILCTAVCEAIHKQYPDRRTIVLTGHPGVFLNNPFVHRVFPYGACPYLYEDYIKGNDVLFLCQEPYKTHGFLNQSQHLIQSWCESLSVKYNQEMPKIFLNPIEIETARSKINYPKPILLIQPFGGATNQGNKYSWNRDIPPHQIQKIVDSLQSKYSVVQVCHGNQIKLNNVTHFTAGNIREVFSLLLFSKSRLLIDSFAQHAAAAMKLPSTVCWITNKPLVFGYAIHNNILPSAQINSNITKIDGTLLEYDFAGSRIHDYPFLTQDVFNTDQIIQSLYQQL